MRIDLWSQFKSLLDPNPRILATVIAHNADGTSSLVTADGATMRAWGSIEGATLPYNVFVRGGKVEATAPNLALLQLDV